MCFQENILPRDLVTANRVWCSFVKGLPYLGAVNKATFIQCLLQVYSQGPQTVRNSHSQNQVCIHNCLAKIKPFHTKNIRVFQNMVLSCLFLILQFFTHFQLSPSNPLQKRQHKTSQDVKPLTINSAISCCKQQQLWRSAVLLCHQPDNAVLNTVVPDQWLMGLHIVEKMGQNSALIS